MDFAQWKKETEDLLAGLKMQRASIQRNIEDQRKALGDVDAQIDEIEKGFVLTETITLEPANGDAEKRRASGVLACLRTMAPLVKDWTPVDDLILLVREAIPEAADNSVRSALLKLSDEGVMEHQGERRSHNKMFRGKSAAPVGEAQVQAEEKPKEPEAQEATRPPAPQPPASVPLLIPAVVEALKKMIARDKVMHIEEKNVSWLSVDIGTTEHNVREAIRMLVAADAVKIDYLDNRKVMSIMPTPGSKDELKQTHLSDSPLFPGMDRPPHA